MHAGYQWKNTQAYTNPFKSGDLLNRQHGFRQGRSTIDLINYVMQIIDKAWNRNQFPQEIVLLITLDVKNTFNSAKWINMLDALQNNFKIPDYLLRMFLDYLRDRTL